MNPLLRYLARPVGDPAAVRCTCCGKPRHTVRRGEAVVALACADCDLLARWVKYP